MPSVEIDPYFIEALKHGLPQTSGVAVGIDRVLAIFLNKKSIAETMSFSFAMLNGL